MRARVRSASFLGEAAFGFVLCLVAAAVALTLSLLAPATIVVRVVVAGLGLAFVIRSVFRSDEKTGRIVTLVVWSAIAAGIWLSGASLPTYVVVHITMAWLVRSLFAYSSLVEVGLDLGVTALALCFAVFAAVRTESIFLTAWCFALVQTLHVAIPAFASRLAERRPAGLPDAESNRGFADAFRAADEALHRIAGRS